MPKARSREEFVKAWNEHVKQLTALFPSLPESQWGTLKEAQAQLYALVQIASNNAFPDEARRLEGELPAESEKGEEQDAEPEPTE